VHGRMANSPQYGNNNKYKLAPTIRIDYLNKKNFLPKKL